MKKVIKTVLFLIVLVLLQQVIHWSGEYGFKSQKRLIEERDLDPAVFFYTESEEALKAEKEVRRRTGE